MADISLQKPTAGQTATLTPQAEDRLVFEFNSTEATLTRDGDNLVMSFEDGASLSLTDFYVAYTSENMPTFIIGGAEVDGESFFETLSEELMPAAGPTSTPQGSGSSVDTIAGTLLGGIDRLGSLDQAYPETFVQDTTLEGDGAVGPLNTPPSILGIVVNPDPDSTLGIPDAFPGAVDVIESGVGRDAGGADSTHSSPNQIYDGEFNATGRVLARDDDEDTLTFSVQNGTGQYGTLSINPLTGEFGYTFDDVKANGLAHNQEVTESFTIMVSDGNGGTALTTVNVTIRGTNDKPSLEISTTDGVVTENAATDATAQGNIAFGDVDNDGSTLTVAGQNINRDDANNAITTETIIEGTYGNLVVQANGSYTYTAGVTTTQKAALEALGGDTPHATETFDVLNKDQHGAFEKSQISITVNGINDKPTINPPADPDNPEDPTNPNPSILDVTVQEAGVGDGDLLTEATDPNENFVGMPSANGKVHASDVDSSDITFSIPNSTAHSDAGYTAYDAKIVGAYGDLYFNTQTGEYVYVLDQGKTQNLDEGDIEQDIFVVTPTDNQGLSGNAAHITVHVKGTNDIPTLALKSDADANTGNLSITEDGNADTSLTVSGTAIGKDDDAHDSLTFDLGMDADGKELTTQSGTYGTLVIDPITGKYTYTVDTSKTQHLDTNVHGEDTFTIYVRDDNDAWVKQEITVAITGKNDTPEIIIKGDDLVIVEAGVRDDLNTPTVDHNEAFAGTPTASGKITAFDKDGDTLSFTAKANDAAHDSYGSFSIDTQGNYTFILNNAEDSAADKLRDGETVIVKYTVTISDGDAQVQQTIEVSITGTNDKPELTLTPTDSIVKEDNTPHDTSDDNLTAIGTWSTDDVDNDGNIQTITAEGGKGSITPDAHGIMTGSVTVEGTYGNLVIHDDETYTYTLGVTDAQKAAVDALGDTDNKEENFTIITTDKHGAHDSKDLTITVNGTNDAPQIVSPDGGNSFVTTDDSELEHGTEYDKNADITRSNSIVFTSVESMNGGKITLDLGFDADGDGINESQEFTVSQNTDSTWTLSPESITVTGQYGEFTFDITGPSDDTTGSFTLDYTYTQTKPYLSHTNTSNHGETKNSAESLEVFIQDSNDSAGQGLNANIDVHINDDGPTVTAAWTDTDKTDGNDITVVLGTGTSINEVDLFTFAYGADQEGATLTFNVEANSVFSIENGTEVWHEGQKIGDIVVEGGHVSFKFNANISGEHVEKPYVPDGIIPNIEFTYTVTDGDNDSESGKVTVDVKNLEFKITGSSVTINDADAASYTQTGLIDINGYDAVDTVTIGGKTITFKDGDLDGEQSLTFDGYTVTVTGFDKDSGQLSYEVSMDKAYTHTGSDDSDREDDITTSYGDKNNDGNADIDIKLDITVNGGTSKNEPSLGITILDDAPTAHDDMTGVKEGNSTSGNVITGEGTQGGTSNADLSGADGYKNENAKLDLDSLTAPDNTWTKTTSDDTVTFTDTHGNSITFKADGSYDFTSKDAFTENTPFDFSYTITDADGDSASAKLTITVEANNDAPIINVSQTTNVTLSEAYLGNGTLHGKEGQNLDGNAHIVDSHVSVDGKIVYSDSDSVNVTFSWNDIQPSLWTSEGEEVLWNADGGTLIGYVGSKDDGSYKEIITVTTNETTTGTIDYTVTLNESVLHDSPNAANGNDYNDDLDGDGTVNPNAADTDNLSKDTLKLGFSLNDGVNTSPGSVHVTIQDDILDLKTTASSDVYATANGVEFEQALDYIAKAEGSIDLGTTLTADGIHEDGFKLANGEILLADGSKLTLTVQPDGSLKATDAHDNLYYTVTVNNVTGQWLVLQHKELPDGVDMSFDITAKDKDGDADTVSITVGSYGIEEAIVNTGDTEQDQVKDVITKPEDGSFGYEKEDGTFGALHKDGEIQVKDEHGNIIGKLTVDEYGNLEFTQTESHKHDAHENEDQLTVKVPVVNENGDVTGHVDVVINIADAEPTAKNDTEDTADADGSYTGNILTGEGTKEGTDNADTIGADGWKNAAAKLDSADITPPAIGGWEAATTVPEGFDFGFEDDHGNTIFFDKDGNYTFTPSENLPAGENSFTFGYSITDADQDSDDATLTITINTPKIEEPKEPTDADNTVTKTDLLTDDSDLSTNATGQIVFTSKDTMDGGKITIGGQEFTVTLNEKGIYVLSTDAANGFTLEDGVAGQLIVSPELSHNPDTGEFTLSFEYDQTQAYTGNKHNDNESVNKYDETAHDVVSFEVFIQDGKEAPNSALGDSTKITVDIKDDGPVIRDTLQSAIHDSYTLDKNNSGENTDYNHTIWIKESQINSIAKQELSALFAINLIKEHADFGADGAASDNSITVTEHSLVIKDTASYNITSGGEKVTIYEEGGKIYGSIGQGENKEIVFEVYLDDAGNVCLKQNLPIDHADGTKINAESGIDEDHYLELKDAIDVKATITVTDGDGDSASTSVTSGLTLKFQDDSPHIVGDEPFGTEGHGQTSSTLVDGKAFAQIQIDFGGDGPGKVLLKNGATYELGIAWIVDENGVGTWQEIQAPEWETSPTIVYYSYENGIHKVIMGDITMTSVDNQNWDMVFDADRKDIKLGFVDGDNDEVNHIVKALTSEDYALEPKGITMLAGADNDDLRGGSGNDTLVGGEGNDILYGSAGEDSLFGNSGHDTIYFDFSDKEVMGGNGNDLFVLQDTLENMDIADILSIDGGSEESDSMDVLLCGLHSVKEVQDLFAKDSTTLSNMEVIMLGDDMKAAQDLQQSLVQDKSAALDGWQSKNAPVNIDGKEYQEYISDDNKLTVLIESHLLTNS